MGIIICLIMCLFINKSYGVPPSPTDRLWEELNGAKSVMTNIGNQLEKFNSLYLMKLENRMNSMASTLSSIDSNVKNLQERAHVWDTFQLHVSAWNEQINTLDKKVEIISKGQEKMLNLDTRMNSISNIEYRTERIIGKLDDNQANLQTIIKTVENQNHDPLLSEFTTRGVLSTLKIIERKLDKLQMSHSSSQSMLAKQISDAKRLDNQEGQGQQKGKLLIKCNTPPIVEELLSDVASKVDVMFDKFTGNDEQSDESSGDDNQDNNENSQESKKDPDLNLIKSLLKRLNQPCKRTIKVLENLEVSIKAIDNTTLAILEDGQAVHNDLLNLCQNNDRKVQTVTSKTGDLLSKIDQILIQIDTKFSAGQDSIASHFIEQKEHFTGILKTELGKSCIPTTIVPKIEQNYDDYLESPRKYSNKFNCDELDPLVESNGIYVLGDSEFKNNAERNYNIRYCEVKNNEIWTVIQRRGNNPDQQKFNLTWSAYKDGFGSLDQDFWFGNDFIYNLSEEKQLMLRVELEDFEGNTAWAEYFTFAVGSEENKYRLKIGGYRGNASDAFSSHNNSSFSTYDRTNDQAPICCPCAASYGGGWWFNSCFEANLNGVYYKQPVSSNYYRGLIWELWLGNYSLKKTKMMVRPKTVGDEFEPVTETEREGTTETEIPEDP